MQEKTPGDRKPTKFAKSSLDAKKYIEDLGLENSEIYEFQPTKESTSKFKARLQLKTMSNYQKIILEHEDGTVSSLETLDNFYAIDAVSPETKSQVLKAIESSQKSTADEWYG